MNDAAFFIMLLLFLSMLCWGLWMVLWHSRSARDVLLDLQGAADHINAAGDQSSHNYSKEDKFAGLGLLDGDERKHFILINNLIPILSAFFGLVISLIFFKSDVPALFFCTLAGLGLGYLIAKQRIKQHMEQYRSQLEFYLPIVMERIVMAVQAGLDVVAALKRVVELEKLDLNQPFSQNAKADPVSQLVESVCKLTESGSSFREALRQVAESSSCTAIKHAFIHLGLAQSEGGELVTPLSELSDSTQRY